MDSKLLNLRCNILHQMNEYILLCGDEDIIDEWFTEGIPDECSIEELKEFAENDYAFIDIITTFECCCRLIKNFC